VEEAGLGRGRYWTETQEIKPGQSCREFWRKVGLSMPALLVIYVGPGRVGPQGRQWSVRKGDAEGVDSWPTTNLCLKDFLHSAW
jgi:hypothetical protein